MASPISSSSTQLLIAPFPSSSPNPPSLRHTDSQCQLIGFTTPGWMATNIHPKRRDRNQRGIPIRVKSTACDVIVSASHTQDIDHFIFGGVCIVSRAVGGPGGERSLLLCNIVTHIGTGPVYLASRAPPAVNTAVCSLYTAPIIALPLLISFASSRLVYGNIRRTARWVETLPWIIHQHAIWREGGDFFFRPTHLLCRLFDADDGKLQTVFSFCAQSSCVRTVAAAQSIRRIFSLSCLPVGAYHVVLVLFFFLHKNQMFCFD